MKSSFFSEGSGNIISSHKKLWKCHSHYFNYQNIHLLPEEFEFISCKYLYFVENLRTNKLKILEGIYEYFYAKKLAHFNVNGYFYIQKTLHFNVNAYSLSFSKQIRCSNMHLIPKTSYHPHKHIFELQ